MGAGRRGVVKLQTAAAGDLRGGDARVQQAGEPAGVLRREEVEGAALRPGADDLAGADGGEDLLVAARAAQRERADARRVGLPLDGEQPASGLERGGKRRARGGAGEAVGDEAAGEQLGGVHGDECIEREVESSALKKNIYNFEVERNKLNFICVEGIRSRENGL